MRTATDTPNTCPSWCDHPADHDLEYMHEGECERYHGATFGDTSTVGVEVTNYVQAFEVDHGLAERTVHDGDVVIWIGGNGADERLTNPEQVRALSAALLKAADKLDEIQGGVA